MASMGGLISRGRPRVYWQTHQTNVTAMQLYDKVAEHSGFVVYRKFVLTVEFTANPSRTRLWISPDVMAA